MQYQSPDVTGHEATIKGLVEQFLEKACADPSFNPNLCVHQCVVYVMEHRPAGCPRVDGSIVQPILKTVTQKAYDANLPWFKRLTKIFRR